MKLIDRAFKRKFPRIRRRKRNGIDDRVTKRLRWQDSIGFFYIGMTWRDPDETPAARLRKVCGQSRVID